MELINPHKDIETYHNPINYDSHNVRFWEELSKELIKEGKGKTLVTKAKGFIDNNCIVKVNSATWNVKPIEGYNKKTYEIRIDYMGFHCSCQGFQKKQLEYDTGKTEVKPLCSHILAVRQSCFLEEMMRKVYK